MHDLRRRRRRFNLTYFWPVLGIAAIVILWTLANARLTKEYSDARITAFSHAIATAKAYSEQLSHTVNLYDQITMTTKFNWEKSDGLFRLEDYADAGIYPTSKSLFVNIVDRNGQMVTSTLPFTRPVDYSDTPWFRNHKAGLLTGLQIHGPDTGKITGKEIIRFSRRLETFDGEFDGVVWVSVEPFHIASYYDEGNLREDDFISVRHDDGPVLATKINGPSRIFYREDPFFEELSVVKEEPAAKFADNKARIVAWTRLENYPLVALAAISETSAFVAYEAEKRELIEIVSAATLFIMVFTVIAIYLAAHLTQKRRRDEEVKSIFRLAVDSGRDGFYMIRPLYDEHGTAVDFQVEDCNQQGAALAGFQMKELIGKKFSCIYSGDYLNKMVEFFRLALTKGFHEDELAVSPQSKIKAQWVQRRAVRSGADLAMTVRDISEIKAHEQALSQMANADALTSLPNRHWLNRFLPTALEQAKTNGSEVALLFIDLDNFKNINDTLGHQAGDELLKAAAMRLKALVRASDHVVRLGGDEFTIILEDVKKIDEVTRVAGKIIQSLSEPFKLGNTSGNRIQASIGISMFPLDGEDGETLLKNADIAMYAAKAAGKGRHHFYQTHLSDTLVLRVSKEQALRNAIERDEFVLHYQPRVDTYTGQLRSAEALVRWNHPERGLVSPGEFIEVAEHTGLIVPLGEMIIEKACKQIAEWKRRRIPVVPISVNVSALQFNKGNVRSILASCLNRYAVEPSLIGVELTESCMIKDDDTVPHELEALRKLGVKLLIDDFGTGYSSLAQLQELDVDILKIDQAFTRRICDGKEGKAFFNAIVSMADALDICIVAEGVETIEQLHLLQILSCEEVQGNLISKAVPPNEMASLMSKQYLFPQYA
ncbi:EAL domain-containing protein [Oxalobacteraceae bacterium R-40]|uniref:EAL domain-containing protein n=1 Tax=Keguizhuia sedimenti TaxID=3064264 RepID=A0ABU1BJF1_9BURK|nr:EAL domain-containing protein [Oxalobacteraceae bacterium R-40]